jgi:DUF4097 and DUF4098 domain-containing protein YvlB
MRVRAIASAALAVAALSIPAAAQESVDVRRSAGATGPMEVHVMNGEVKLTGWNRNEVHVTGQLGRDAERLEVTTEGGRVVVRVHHPRGSRGGRGSTGTELEIHYPARRTLNVQTVSAEVAVESPAAAVHVTTVSGNITVEGQPTELEANSRSGEIQLQGNTGRLSANSISGGVQVEGAVRGEAHINTVSGDIQLDGAVGSLRAHSVSGSIHAENVTAAAEAQSVSGDIRIIARTLSGEYSTVSGSVTLAGRPAGGRTLEVQSHSGEIELRVPRGTDAEVELTTWSGEIEIDFEGARMLASSRRERTVRLGSGGARVEISTFSGSARITQQ